MATVNGDVFKHRDNCHRTYTKASEETRWEREIVNEHEYQFNKDIMEKLEAAWFIVEDGVYVLEEAHHVDVMEEEAKALIRLTIELEKDALTLTIIMGEAGTEITVTMTFTDINRTTVVVPTFDDVMDVGSDPGVGDSGETIPGAVPLLNDTLESRETNTHVITIETAGQYAIYTESNVDTVGSLSHAGVMIAEDDDSGQAFNFKIIITLEPGDYELDVWGWMSAYGPYTLFVVLLD